MKRNLADFTRGSQLLGHFGFMFAAGLKGPIIVALAVISGMSWWTLSSGMTDHESYLVWMRVYAAAYGFMEFDPHKLVALETGFGGTVQFPISLVEVFPPVVRAWAHMLDLLRSAMLRSLLALVPAFAFFLWFAAHFGKRAKERKHERGATLTTLPELVAEISQHNRQERAAELSAALGWRWRLCMPRELAKAFPYRPAHIASVTYPWRLEQSHAMLIGTTGMGKTVAMSEMIAEARRKGQRAVVFDLTGSFIEQFYDSRYDVILNPLDARCPQWSVFGECHDEAEFSAVAEALVPHDGGGSEQFWVLAARLLFVEMCLKLQAQGHATNEALASQLMTADLAKVHAMMRHTVADPITAPEAARMAESIRAVFNANAKALKLLPKKGPRFSVRDWVEDEDRPGSMVFISARYIDMSVCSQLLTVWLDTAMNTLMALERTRDLRIWFFIDEMGALHRLPALEKGLQTARNFGGAIVIGIHAYAKLKEVYGENMAMTLSALARTKLIFGVADPDSATWCSSLIGNEEVRDVDEGFTYGYNNARDAVSLTGRKHVQPLRLPDQLMNMKRLTAYLKFPDGFPAAPVKLTPVARARRADPFIRRAPDQTAAEDTAEPANPPKPGLTKRPDSAAENPAANDDGAGKRLVLRQGELPLGSGQGEASDTREIAPRPADDALLHDQGHVEAIRGSQDTIASSGVRGSDGEAANSPDRAATLPMDKVLRAGASDAAQPEKPEEKHGQSPVAPKPGLKASAIEKVKAVPAAGEARKLMLEDGMPEREAPDIGDLDMDM